MWRFLFDACNVCLKFRTKLEFEIENLKVESGKEKNEFSPLTSASCRSAHLLLNTNAAHAPSIPFPLFIPLAANDLTMTL